MYILKKLRCHSHLLRRVEVFGYPEQDVLSKAALSRLLEAKEELPLDRMFQLHGTLKVQYHRSTKIMIPMADTPLSDILTPNIRQKAVRMQSLKALATMKLGIQVTSTAIRMISHGLGHTKVEDSLEMDGGTTPSRPIFSRTQK